MSEKAMNPCVHRISSESFVTCARCGAFARDIIIDMQERITALEKVAEAAIKLVALCELVADEEIELDDALREAGYGGEE